MNLESSNQIAIFLYMQVADVCKKLAAALHLGDKLVAEKEKVEKKKKSMKSPREC